MKRKCLSLLLMLILLISLAVPVSAISANEARNSVVVVSTLLETDAGSVGFGHGTGFFVTDQYLITNFHVIESFEEYGSGELVSLTVDGIQISGRAKVRAYYDSKDNEEAYVVGYDSIRDIAVLRLGSPTSKRTPLSLRIPTEDMVGNTVYAVGFPGLADNILADSTSSWGKNDSTVTSGTISRLVTQSGTGQRNIQIDCDIKHGNSGGPLIDGDGAVVGVTTWSVSNSNLESVKYAVNIEEVIQLLNQYRVDYTLAGSDDPASFTSDSAENDSQPNPIISDPVISNPVISDPITPTPVPEKESNVGLIIAIVVAVLAVCSVAVLLVIVLRKKKPDPIPVPAAPVIPQKVPTVRSCARINYGAHAPVSGRPIMVGRNDACALRFPNNAPGISGSHCSVQFDDRTKDFIVMDLNSTYGTFLITGQKMAPNVPYRMRAGDKFYLADQNNMIALELE